MDLLSELARAGDGAVVATLIATHGARPRNAGARLLIHADGTTRGSVTLGGCVEQRLIEAARAVSASGSARLLLVDLAEEEALDLGMGCAATLELLVEPARSIARDADMLRERVARGQRAALILAPDAPDARLLVFDDGGTHGSLGDAGLDAYAAEHARASMRARRSGLLSAGDGRPRLFIDVHAPPKNLFVFGVGPVTAPLVRFARELELRTVVVDGRVRRSDDAPDADDVRLGSPSAIASELSFDPESAVVVLAHDYKQELPILERVLAGEPAYVGMLGNRRRGQAVLDMLRERGVPADAVARVRVPAGLDLGAETPAEIALAILAEIVAAFGGRSAR